MSQQYWLLSSQMNIRHIRSEYIWFACSPCLHVKSALASSFICRGCPQLRGGGREAVITNSWYNLS
jgi:hypothetical protein